MNACSRKHLFIFKDFGHLPKPSPTYHTSSRNRKLEISTAPTKAKSWEPAYSQALNQNKIDRLRSESRESGRQTARWLWWMVFGVEMGWEARGRR